MNCIGQGLVQEIIFVFSRRQGHPLDPYRQFPSYVLLDPESAHSLYPPVLGKRKIKLH
jgi:hypothetical protein